ncbi:uncharacterized protein METZ01_LOCUS321287, partial [marine metagenome]
RASFGTRRSWVQIPPTRPWGLGRLLKRIGKFRPDKVVIL